ncbi:small, acid-soluble spore protein, alpha/beta type [Paenibacillus albus]|uniref:Small, acid-soluble spore protein, alpha/beta type n=1 Tax=Paenibacillus albus TaxID=2495582 RepID=A0A3S9A0W4_9BACL|nr:small, acid-soluble spore protein, alpha/beta type [Paenibacillus albus]AZN39399.1 small, acid-soluble spore protein, alpha/beta type [Paenibacillus albus]
MARRSRRKHVVPAADAQMSAFKAEVMRREGYVVNPSRPDDVKYEVAKSLGIPLEHGYNGQLSTESAGQIGGQIGGAMVKELIRMAQEKLANEGRQ